MNLKKSLAKRLGRWANKTLGLTKPIGTGYGFKKQQAMLGDKPDTIIFDVGANSGQSAHEYRRFFSQASIYSFEPAPDTYKQLCETARADSRIFPVQMALSDWQGSAPLHLYPNSFTNSLLRLQQADSSPLLQTVNVPVSTIDHFCTEKGITHIDILKTDTQGHDLAVLKGARELLSQGKIKAVYIEVLFEPMYENQDQFHQVCSYMHELGYQLHDLYDCARHTSGRLSYADALFTKL